MNKSNEQLIDISVVIPCYNSEKSIEELTNRIIETLNKREFIYELIFINDNSKDNTLGLLQKLSHINENITVIDLMFNVGQFKALMCGLANSSGKYWSISESVRSKIFCNFV